MAPEAVRQQGSDLSADIWSVGCTVIEMATARPPWIDQVEGGNQVQAIFKIGNGDDTPRIPGHLSPTAQAFARVCLQRDRRERPTADELLEHSFIRIPGPRPSAPREGGDGGDDFDPTPLPYTPVPSQAAGGGRRPKHRRVRSEGGDKLLALSLESIKLASSKPP